MPDEPLEDSALSVLPLGSRVKNGSIINGYELAELTFRDGATEVWKATRDGKQYLLSLRPGDLESTILVEPEQVKPDHIEQVASSDENISQFPTRKSTISATANRLDAPPSPDCEKTFFHTRASFNAGGRWDTEPFDTEPQTSDAAVPTFPEGTLLGGRYRVTRLIGTGGRSRVYLVADQLNLLSSEFAIKIPSLNNPTRQFVEELMSAHKVWKSLSDENPEFFVRLKAIERLDATEAKVVGIFMEHFRKGSLSFYMSRKMPGRGPGTQEEFLQVTGLLYHAALAIAAMHRKHVIHRDIKPANFVVSDDEKSCKLGDFELAVTVRACENNLPKVGTPSFMAPELVGDGLYSIASDIYAFGMTMYYLLLGANTGVDFPTALSRLADLKSNPIVPVEMRELIASCLDQNPNNRPQSADDVAEEFLHLGLAGHSASQRAPANLAKLIIENLLSEERDFLTESLKRKGLRSLRAGSDNEKDLIEEYCYTTPPNEILEAHFTNGQLRAIAGKLNINPDANRKLLVKSVVKALGFLHGPTAVEGVAGAAEHLSRQAWALSHADTADEMIGIASSSLAALERVIDIYNSFFGQLVYGRGVTRYVSQQHGSERELTLGRKAAIFRELLLKPPVRLLPSRYKELFTWPVVTKEIQQDLDRLVEWRNVLIHKPASIIDLASFTRGIVELALALVQQLAVNPCCPRNVQIESKEIDSFGRQFYTGRQDQGRAERIFTPLPLTVGQTYLFFPLTNPSRVHPILFPRAMAER